MNALGMAGWAVSAYFSYMKGVNNALALKHVPQVRFHLRSTV